MNVNQINIKEYLETAAKIESPNVQKLFQEKKAAPNLKDRRKLAAQNKGLSLGIDTAGDTTF